MEAATKPTQEEIMEARRKLGHDRWDEMWDGELHMTPAPSFRHYDMVSELHIFFRQHWAKARGAYASPGGNVAMPGGWPVDYRVPDVILLAADRLHLKLPERIEGPPNVVIEVRSPGDETYLKLDFYCRLGVPETWIIDRDSCVPEIYVLESGQYVVRRASETGWLTSNETGVELKIDSPGRLLIRVIDKPETTTLIPE